MIHVPHKTYSRRKRRNRRKTSVNSDECFLTKKPNEPIFCFDDTLPDDIWKDSFDKLKDSKTPRSVKNKRNLRASPFCPTIEKSLGSKQSLYSEKSVGIGSTPICSRSQSQLICPISPIKRKYFSTDGLYNSKGEPQRVFEYSSDLASNVCINLSHDSGKNNFQATLGCSTTNVSKNIAKKKTHGRNSITKHLKRSYVRLTKMSSGFPSSTSNIPKNSIRKGNSKNKNRKKRKSYNFTNLQISRSENISEIKVVNNSSKNFLETNGIPPIHLIEGKHDTNEFTDLLSDESNVVQLAESHLSINPTDISKRNKSSSCLENFKDTLALSLNQNVFIDKLDSTQPTEIDSIGNTAKYENLNNGGKNQIDCIDTRHEIDLLETNSKSSSKSLELMEESQNDIPQRKQKYKRINLIKLRKKSSSIVETSLQSVEELRNFKKQFTKNKRKLSNNDKKSNLENVFQTPLQIEHSTDHPDVIYCHGAHDSSNILNCHATTVTLKNSMDNSNIRITKPRLSTNRGQSDRLSFITLRRKRNSNMVDNSAMSTKHLEVEENLKSKETNEPNATTNLNKTVGSTKINNMWADKRSIQSTGINESQSKDKSKTSNTKHSKSKNNIVENGVSLEDQNNISEISSQNSCSNNILIKSIHGASDKCSINNQSNELDAHSQIEINQCSHKVKEASAATKNKCLTEANLQLDAREDDIEYRHNFRQSTLEVQKRNINESVDSIVNIYSSIDNKGCFEGIHTKKQLTDLHQTSFKKIPKCINNLATADINEDIENNGYKDNSIDRSIDRNEFMSILNKSSVSFNRLKSLAKNSLSRNSFKKGLNRPMTKSQKSLHADTIIYESVHENIENVEEDFNELREAITLQPGKWRKSLTLWRRNNSIITDKKNETKISSVRCDLSVNKSLMPIFCEADNCGYSTGDITRNSSLTNRSSRNARRTILDCSKLKQTIPENEVISSNILQKSNALLLEPTDDESPNLSTLSLLDNTVAKQTSLTLRRSEVVTSKNNCSENYSGDSSEISNEKLRRYQHQLSIPLYRQPSISRRRRTSFVDSSLPRIVGTICDTDLFAEFVRISPYEVSLRSQLDARDIVLRRCCQSEPLLFSDVYSEKELHQCRKIGEGVYGEVFMNKSAHGETVVLKIIPIEGCIEVNGETQKKFEEILSEIAIAMELSRLRNDKEFMTCGFVEVKQVRCVQGRYPDNLIDLWDLYRENCGTENDHPEIFPDDQLYIVLELANGGQDLEAFTFQNALQSYSAFIQTALTLAVAEHKFQFEHRDLHWGNILLAQTEEKELTFRINGKEIKIPTHGVKATIIDYTLSRMIFDGCCLYNDLSHDNELFSASGDYQFDIYRLMKKSLEGQWERFEPYTNVLWLHYTIDKMISGARYRCSKSKKHRSAIQGMMQLRDELLDYKSASDYVECLN